MERGPHGERCPYPGTFLTHTPGSPVKELTPTEAPSKEPLQRETLHPQSPLHPSLRRGPYGNRCPSPEPFLPVLQDPQQGSPPFTELPQRDTPSLVPFSTVSQSPGRWAHSRLPNWAPMRWDTHPQSPPFITFSAPSTGAPLQVPLKELP